MRTITPLHRAALAAAFLLLLWHTPVLAQGELPPKPFMWISKTAGATRREHFDSLKLAAFSKATGVTQHKDYHLGNFLGMIQYFRNQYGADFAWLEVYLGIYGPDQPADRAGRLTLIFAPFSFEKGNLGLYDLPDSSFFDSSNAGQYQIDTGAFNVLTARYAALMPLNSISDSDEYNQYKGKLSDTRSVRYCAGDLDTLVSEQSRIHYRTDGKTVMHFTKNFIAFFGAYEQAGAHFNNRTVLTFNWTDEKGRIIFLEDTYDFYKRKPGMTACPDIYKMKINPLGADNGLLCPPNCPN